MSLAENTIIYSPTNGYWQCGVWVRRSKDATVYRDVREAQNVAALRRLPADIEFHTRSDKE